MPAGGAAEPTGPPGALASPCAVPGQPGPYLSLLKSGFLRTLLVTTSQLAFRAAFLFPSPASCEGTTSVSGRSRTATFDARLPLPTCGW